MNMKLFKLILPLMLLATVSASAQCRSFTKKRCLPQLDGYVQNDNFNSAVLIPGDEAELLLTFYADTEYRLLVCGHPILGDIEFDVLDTDQEILYTNRDTEDHSTIFDFKVATTQQLIVRVRVPESETASPITHEGCVSIMVGSKE
jgi:hypothetical protein